MFDFDEEFEKFAVKEEQTNAISEIYKVIPALSQEQMQIVHTLLFYSERYQLNDLKSFVVNYLRDMKGNKNLNFMSSMNMKNLLKAYTQEELIRGIKVNSSVKNDE